MRFNLENLVNYIMLKAHGSVSNKLSAVKVIRSIAKRFAKKLAKKPEPKTKEAQQLQLAAHQTDAAVYLAWPLTQNHAIAKQPTCQLILAACLAFLEKHKDLLWANVARNIGDRKAMTAEVIVTKIKESLK